MSISLRNSTVEPFCSVFQELSTREQSLLHRSNGCTRLQWALHFLDSAFWTRQVRVRHAACCADCLTPSNSLRSAA